MKRSKFSEHQIIAILKAVKAGRTVKDVCREHEISDATYYQLEVEVRWACKRQTSSACVNWKTKCTIPSHWTGRHGYWSTLLIIS